jgi:hypothetical protein
MQPIEYNSIKVHRKDIYVPQTKFGRHIVFAPFLIIILIIILSFFLSFFRQKFIRHISRRLQNGNQGDIINI